MPALDRLTYLSIRNRSAQPFLMRYSSLAPDLCTSPRIHFSFIQRIQLFLCLLLKAFVKLDKLIGRIMRCLLQGPILQSKHFIQWTHIRPQRAFISLIVLRWQSIRQVQPFHAVYQVIEQHLAGNDKAFVGCGRVCQCGQVQLSKVADIDLYFCQHYMPREDSCQ